MKRNVKSASKARQLTPEIKAKRAALGAKFKARREAAQLSQRQIARKLKISQPQYHRIEHGLTPIAERHRARFAEVFSIALSSLG